MMSEPRTLARTFRKRASTNSKGSLIFLMYSSGVPVSGNQLVSAPLRLMSCFKYLIPSNL